MNDFPDDNLIRRLSRLADVEPTPDATRRALERVRRVLVENPVYHAPLRRRVMLKHVAAAAAVVLGAGGLFAWLLLPSSAVLANFADVQAALKAAHSVTCRQTIHREGQPDQVTHIFVLGSGLWRAEDRDGSYTVIDTAKHKTLAVDPKKRRALLLQGANLPQVNLYEKIKNLPNDTSARPLPAKKLDGKDVLGFRVKMFDLDATVWADAKTRLPVRIEAEEKNADGKLSRLTLDEFVFDKELDPKLFSFEAPPGYKLDVQGIAELPAAPEDPKLKNLIVTPLVGIGPVKFGMSREQVEKALGKADAVQAEGKNGYVSMNYGSRGVFLGVSKTLGVVTISCVSQATFAIRIRDFTGKTDKGIALGEPLADVIKVYGEPDHKETNHGSTYVSYNRLQASFTFFDGKLVQMLFTKPRPAP
jgi:outer membrane lipoprotein-sorting protein